MNAEAVVFKWPVAIVSTFTGCCCCFRELSITLIALWVFVCVGNNGQKWLQSPHCQQGEAAWCGRWAPSGCLLWIQAVLLVFKSSHVLINTCDRNWGIIWYLHWTLGGESIFTSNIIMIPLSSDPSWFLFIPRVKCDNKVQPQNLNLM